MSLRPVCRKVSLACLFCFPNSDHEMFFGEFVFYIMMHTYTRGFTCKRSDDIERIKQFSGVPSLGLK